MSKKRNPWPLKHGKYMLHELSSPVPESHIATDDLFLQAYALQGRSESIKQACFKKQRDCYSIRKVLPYHVE